MNSAVSQTLSGHTNCILVNEADLRKKNPSSFTALIKGVTKLYSLFPGTAKYTGSWNGLGTLNIAVSEREILRYLHLTSSPAWKGYTIEAGGYIGEVSTRLGLGFEYCTQWQGDSKYPVRIAERTYFKQNPIDILDGLYTSPMEVSVISGIIRPNEKVEFTEDQLSEWTYNQEEDEYDLQITISDDPSIIKVEDARNMPQSARNMISNNGGGK